MLSLQVFNGLCVLSLQVLHCLRVLSLDCLNLSGQVVLLCGQIVGEFLRVGNLLVLRLDGGIQGGEQTFVHEGTALLHLHLLDSEKCKYCGIIFFHINTVIIGV